MSDTPPAATLLDLANAESALRTDMAGAVRAMAAVMADPRTLAASQRPVTMGRRMGQVTAVDIGPPLTADVELNGVTITGASPQATYRPQVDDLVWLEFLGPDAHISSPLASEANQSWTVLTLAGAWVVHLDAPAYWRDMQGMVHLQGNLAAGANGTFASLPAGYRPQADRVYSVPTYASAAWGHSVVVVRASGTVEFAGPVAPTAVYLDGVHFRVD